jgi:hypothetical protein
MKVTTLVVILILAGAILLAAAFALVGRHAIDAAANYAERPASATELVLLSRQTAPATTTQDNGSLWGAGLLAILLLLLASLTIGLRNGAELLKQWRLARRPSPRQSWRPPSYRNDEIGQRTIPRVPVAPYLPEVNHDQDADPLD